MSHILQVKLGEGFTDGFFVIQHQYSEEDFAKLLQGKLPKDLILPYVRVYCDFARSNSGTIVCDDKSPWVIVVFGSDPRLIRRRTLSEIAQLAKALVNATDTQARFIERVFNATLLP